MNLLCRLVLRLSLWDCSYSIQCANTRIRDLREQVAILEAEEDRLATELLGLETQL